MLTLLKWIRRSPSLPKRKLAILFPRLMLFGSFQCQVGRFNEKTAFEHMDTGRLREQVMKIREQSTEKVKTQ